MGECVDFSEFGVLITICKVKLAVKPNFSIVCVRRGCNGVAHTLARRAIISAISTVREAPPEWLMADSAKTCLVDQ
ncbi:hypothetical protein LINGRAPRIM_LOCUS686 [Linum grandiflorum]